MNQKTAIHNARMHKCMSRRPPQATSELNTLHRRCRDDLTVFSRVFKFLKPKNQENEILEYHLWTRIGQRNRSFEEEP